MLKHSGKKLRRELDYEEYDKIFKQLKVAGVKKLFLQVEKLV